MIDIETLGLGPASVILSVGAVRFNPMDTPGMFYKREVPMENVADTSQTMLSDDVFYMVCDPIEQQTRYGLQVEAGTVMWWLSDPSVSPTAREALAQPNKPGLETLLAELSGWLALGGGTDVPVWSNGSLDINVLTTAFQVGGYGKPPWRYDAVRDYRTVAKENAHLVTAEEWVHAAVKHDALADAIAQATNLQRIYNRLYLPVVA